MVMGVLTGYLSIRSLLIKTINIAQESRKTIEPYLSARAVTKLYQAENELVALNDTFSAVTKQLEANISELKMKNEELKNFSQLKDEFVNTVSHEFRQPLTIVQESINQMVEGMCGPVNEAQLKYLNMSLRNVNRLKTLVDDMLDISKIEKGKLTISKENVDIARIINEVISDFSQKINKKGLEIKASLPAQTIEIMVDKDKIVQILINLIGNAYKFTEKGCIEISVRDNVTSIECRVADTGKGIAAQGLPHLFSKFHQIGTQPEKGTGLGLVITKHMIELHNGQIYVESKEGVGSTFIFTLPKVSTASQQKDRIL